MFGREFFGDARHGAAGFGRGESRPPGEIGERGGGVAAEIDSDQPSQCLFTGRFFAARSPFVEKGVGRSAFLVGAAADDAVRFGPHQQMPQRILREWNAPLIQRFSDFLFRPVFVPFQRLLQQVHVAVNRFGVESGVCAPGVGVVGGTDAVGSEREHPAQVFRRNEMPRRTQQVRAQDVAPVQGGFDLCGIGRCGAAADGPFGHAVVLGLYGSHPLHDLLRSVERRLKEQLVAQPQFSKRCHGGFVLFPDSGRDRGRIL